LLGEEHYVDGTWGFGVKGSPARNYLTGYVALAMGDYGRAALALQSAVESGCYDNAKMEIEDLIRGLKLRSEITE
jgi:hypothetical protein